MEEITSLAEPKKRSIAGLLISIPWFALSCVVVIITLSLLLASSLDTTAAAHPKYSIFSSKPPVSSTITSDVVTADSRSERINQFFEKYDCPIAGNGNAFVSEADKNNIPFWIVPSIAFQESSCGKKTPTINGAESYNAWGWGVYDDKIKMFEDWEHGIKVVSKYLADTFYSKGITDPCEIMKIYTPPSRGSWCEGVEFFREEIENYKTP